MISTPQRLQVLGFSPQQRSWQIGNGISAPGRTRCYAPGLVLHLHKKYDTMSTAHVPTYIGAKSYAKISPELRKTTNYTGNVNGVEI
jgi:hypothetical protein